MREYDERLLSTVYWTLGSAIVLGGLLVGFGWNANSRSYDRDRAALRQELQGLAREDFANLQEALNQRFDSAMKTANDSAANLRDSVGSKAEAAAKAAEDRLSSKINALDSRVVEQELKALEREADYWANRGIPGNEIRSALDIAHKAQSLRIDYFREQYTAEALDRVRKILKAGPDLDAAAVADLVEGLRKIPERFSTEVEALHALLRNMRSA